jgi:hypothetical protein
VLQSVNHSVPPPAWNGAFEHPGMATPSLVNVTVPPPSLGFTSATNLTDCPAYEVAEDELTAVALGAPYGELAASAGAAAATEAPAAIAIAIARRAQRRRNEPRGVAPRRLVS